MKSLLFGLMIAMSAALPAAAENWVDLNEGGRPMGLDIDSILTDNRGNYNFWMMHRDGQIIRQANAVISCSERTISMLNRKSFTLNGELIEALPFIDQTPDDIVIDSNAAVYYNYLCN